MAFNSTGEKTYPASGAVSACRVVELTATGAVTQVITAGTVGIGVATEDIADGGYGNIRLWNAGGTYEIAVSGTAVTPATLYQVGAGGYAIASGGTGPLQANESGVASTGIILEFGKV